MLNKLWVLVEKKLKLLEIERVNFSEELRPQKTIPKFNVPVNFKWWSKDYFKNQRNIPYQQFCGAVLLRLMWRDVGHGETTWSSPHCLCITSMVPPA